jgi:hypothetical protein
MPRTNNPRPKGIEYAMPTTNCIGNRTNQDNRKNSIPAKKYQNNLPKLPVTVLNEYFNALLNNDS